MMVCAGCTARTEQGAPAWEGRSRLSLDATASCLVRSVDLALASKSQGVTTSIRVKEPGKSAEIGLVQQVNGMNEMFYVRLDTIGRNETRVALFVIPTWRNIVEPAMQVCAERV
jgi:hypothetical protein